VNVHVPVKADATQPLPDYSGTPVRADYIPASDYVSPQFARREEERLWPRVWQMACREEEIPKVGDYYTYDIVDDSIIVVRTAPDEIKAYHNVCMHRGRRLTKGCGHTVKLHCKFHGWQWNLDGKNITAIDRDDWGACLKDEDIALATVKVGRWGGFVYINMDPDCEPLEEALYPANTILDPFDLGSMRYKWRKGIIFPCNWKVAIEAFDEAYHVQETHRQLLEWMDDITVSFAHGRHGMFAYWTAKPLGMRSDRLGGGPEDGDLRPGIAAYMQELKDTLNSGASDAMVAAGQRLMQELPPGTPQAEVLAKFGEYVFEYLQRENATPPTVAPEQVHAAGTDWHVFPNQVMLSGPTGILGYRVRPNGHDQDSCIWEAYSLHRYPNGESPKVDLEWSDDPADEKFWGLILCQDYQNMGEVQRGLKSRGFRGARPNPVQEVPVSNFHRALHEFLGE